MSLQHGAPRGVQVDDLAADRCTFEDEALQGIVRCSHVSQA
jgi:hypothetical protein